MEDDLVDYVFRGTYLKEDGKIDQAIDLYRMRISRFPYESTPHWHLAFALDEKGLTDEAMQECRIALTLAPASWLARVQLAEFLERGGKLQEALEELENGARLNPKTANPLLEKARMCLRHGMRDEAIEALSRVISNSLNLKRNAMLQLADIYMEDKNYAQAISLLETYVTGHKKAREGHFKFGNALAAMGRIAEAKKAWRRVLWTDPLCPLEHKSERIQTIVAAAKQALAGV